MPTMPTMSSELSSAGTALFAEGILTDMSSGATPPRPCR